MKNYRQPVLKYAFEGKITEEWREEHRSEIKLLKEIKMTKNYEAEFRKINKQVREKSLKSQIDVLKPKKFEMPVDWEIVLLDDLVSIITSGSRGWAKYYSKDGLAKLPFRT